MQRVAMPKKQGKSVLNIRISIFGFVSNFDIRYSNLFRTLCFLLFWFIFFSTTVRADVISEALDGQELLFQRKYPEAIKLFEGLENKYPESPSGSFGLMATYQLMMFENIDFRFSNEYSEIEKRFESAVDKMLSGKPSSWDLFMSGAGYGMRGFYYARADKWFRALGSAIRAVQLLKRSVFENPNFKDAYLGIGMYNYWRSVLTKGLSFLPFFGDRRKEGIEQIETAGCEGVYAQKLSESNLAFIYAYEKKFTKSREIVDRYLAQYPQNILLRQLSARLYFLGRKFEKAADEYKKIVQIDSAMTKSYYYLGVVYKYRPDGIVLAKDYFEKFLATNPEKEWAKYAHNQLESFKKSSKR